MTGASDRRALDELTVRLVVRANRQRDGRMGPVLNYMGALPAITVLVPGGYAHTLGDAQAMRHAADCSKRSTQATRPRRPADGLTTAEHVVSG